MNKSKRRKKNNMIMFQETSKRQRKVILHNPEEGSAPSNCVASQRELSSKHIDQSEISIFVFIKIFTETF